MIELDGILNRCKLDGIAKMKMRVPGDDKSDSPMIGQDTPKYFDDDGTEISSDPIPQAGLCLTCKKMRSREQESFVLMLMNRMNKMKQESY